MPPKESKDGRPSSRSSRPSTRRSTPVNTPSSSKPSAPPSQPSSAPPRAISASASASGSVNHGSESDWSEPPLATPKASYKEYDDKALMNTSTQHMLPLGELPSAKMLEATKRPYPHQGKKKGKQVANIGNGAGNAAAGTGGGGGGGGSMGASKVANGGAGIGGGGGGGGGAVSPSTPVSGSSRATQTHTQAQTQTNTQTPTPTPTQTPMQTLIHSHTLSQAQMQILAQAQAQAHLARPVITTPAPAREVSPGVTIGSSGSPPANPSTPANGARPTASAPWLNGNAPNSKTPQGRQRLSMVVDAAIERSAQVGNVDLGRAIKKLYDESLSNGLLADLLDAVLAQKATPEQIHQFQTYVRNARDPNAQSAEPSGRSHDSTGGVVVKKEKLSKKEKKKNGLKKHQHGDQGLVDDDTDSDLSSVSSDMFDDHHRADGTGGSTTHHRHRVPSPVNSFTPIQSEYRRSGDFEHPAKRLKLPTFDEIHQDSSIRDPPPIGAIRKGPGNPRKRPRSHSISTPPPPVSASASVTPSSSVMAPTSAPTHSGAPIYAQPPKKKNKSNKTKIS